MHCFTNPTRNKLKRLYSNLRLTQDLTSNVSMSNASIFDIIKKRASKRKSKKLICHCFHLPHREHSHRRFARICMRYVRVFCLSYAWICANSHWMRAHAMRARAMLMRAIALHRMRHERFRVHYLPVFRTRYARICAHFHSIRAHEMSISPKRKRNIH